MLLKLLRSGSIVVGLAGTVALAQPPASRLAPPASGSASGPPALLLPTPHPPLPLDLSRLWLVPTATDRSAAAANPAFRSLQDGLKLYDQKKYEQALARFAAAAAPQSPLRGYAAYYAGVSELRLERFAAARRRFSGLKDAKGYLSQAATLGEAEAAQGLRDFGAEVKLYDRLLGGTLLDDDAVWLSLATAAMADDNRVRAAEAYLHLYYELPASGLAMQAEGPLDTLSEVEPIAPGNTRYTLEMGRAERLFDMRRIADARTSFLRVKPHARGGDAELVALRLAECDYFQQRYIAARDALRPFIGKGARQTEARFFYAMAQRGLKNHASYEQLTRALVKDAPDSSWAEDALNNLATYYILDDRDDAADAVFREGYARYPSGRHAQRAAWKAGWRAYRSGNMADAVRFFEGAAATFPRSDYRPAYLYWSGKARLAMADRPMAIARFQLTVADYLNTYYGSLASSALASLNAAPAPAGLRFVGVQDPQGDGRDDLPPNADVIRTLLALDLYDPALKEIEFAKKIWGTSSAVDATLAWASQQKARSVKGREQFDLARGAINAMKRAYPQYLAAGGEQLPRDVLTVIYPLSYWELIRKYSAAHDLDPYLVAALTAQESTFVADIRSSASAYGLMQLLPSTARQYARKLNMRYSASLLTNPEANIRMGTAYFADKIAQFGSVPLALASYNAGERAVRRWIAERPGLPREEFIDDIPYPETQGYVKRIIGTAEDYRRLYGLQ